MILGGADLVLVAPVVTRDLGPLSGVDLAIGAARAGALPIVHLDADEEAVERIRSVTDRTSAALAVAPHRHLVARPDAPSLLSAAVSTVVLDASVVDAQIGTSDLEAAITRWGTGARVLVEVTSVGDARRAVDAGADGLIAKGAESGGLVGTTETFVLLQQTVDLGVPVWARGGIGLHTAAAAVAVGACGVVLDGQLALVRESHLPAATRSAIAAMDGSETRVVGGHRVYSRPDLAAATIEVGRPAALVARELGPDVERDLVPVGQDAAQASLLAERYRTAGGVIEAVRASIRSHLAAAAAHQPLRAGSGIAEAHAIRCPIAQGPMTRVSDQAAFAAAVADGGGLPFLALALMPGSEVEALLRQTSDLLGGRAWGVGILGFVPTELREEQLEVVRRVSPPVALIAGGRPSQAAPLEADGIATYLHVPSPGLLDRFVKDGARRFVFEGRECGGHVGPRGSFPLWEAQVERLSAVVDPQNLHLLFAGGVHDARSAAAVAALAGPLAAGGARIGVLMGTAYLFTTEAVATGAITRAFQDTAVGCAETVLLETSPGHSTRCVDTDYVQVFADTKANLEAEGMAATDVWAQLELLNLGRLRVASKGLVHGDAGPTEVDEATQRREGMYMIGQVATLRREVTTIAALHEEVVSGGADRIREVAARAATTVTGRDPTPPPLDIAIVGMASMFPGSTNVDDFWASVVAGANAITEVPRARWDPDIYFDPDAVGLGAGRKTPSKWGGFLPAAGFDALAYGIPPASLAAIEPVQLLSLEVASQALADAGYAVREFDRSRASVVFGAESGNDLGGAYGLRAMLPQLVGDLPPEVDDHLPTLTEDSFPGVLTNVIAGRIANRLDLGGINLTVDAACASSLAALDVACKELATGNSDLVLCGGADVHNGINDYLLFASVHALSPTGQCRTFDAAADGIVLGEGIACVVLKRREDAERDGDRIYAIVEAVAGSSDGRHLGLTAPRLEGQQRALERAYAQARRSPADLGLVEAHGTGTVVGDKTELTALTGLFGARGAVPGSCVLGSVKSQIGHTKCTAGLAGLIKASRALFHGVLPPTCNLRSPNAAFEADTSPFRFVDEARPWPEPHRHAGVSAFGFGGANFHAVLSSYDGADDPAHGVAVWPAELFLIRAEQMDTAREQLERLSVTVDAVLAADPNGRQHRLRDLAATVSAGGRGPTQVAIVATDFRDLADKLVVARSGTARRDGVFLADPDDGCTDRSGTQTAFLYPGQGSQRTGMLADLFVAFPQLRDLLAFDPAWVEPLYPRAAFSADERAAQAAALTDTTIAQPVLGLCGLAMTRLLGAVGVRPATTAGHSYGELVALAAAGVMTQADLLRLSEARGRAIADAAAERGDDPGSMAAIGAPVEVVVEALRAHPDVVVANHNGPAQVVLSGPTEAVAAAVDDLGRSGVAAKSINVACAFHSPVIAGASARLAEAVASTPVTPPEVTVWCNTTASPYPADPAEIRALLAAQVSAPVRFVDEIEAMYAAGVRVFVEAGPGRVLTQLVGKILGDRPHRAVATDASGEHGVGRFLLAVAELAVAGHDLDTSVLFDGRAEIIEAGALPAPTPGWTIDGHLIRTASGEIVPGSLRPADEFPTLVATGFADDREATVLEYLRGVREALAAERDVMLRYLGAPAGPTASPLDSPSPAVNGHAPTNGHNGSTPSTPVEREATAASPPAGPVRGDALLAVVLQLVAERTGYPTDMLDPDLDLEADLSIDSIKRIEIIGELAERIGLDSMADDRIDDELVEELAQLKSLREIVSWIDGLTDGSDAGAPSTDRPDAPDRAADTNGADAGPQTVPAPPAAVRHVVTHVEVGPPAGDESWFDGARVVIADDGRGLSTLVAARLEACGASVSIVDAEHQPTDADAERMATCDALVWLRALHPDTATDPGSYDARSAFAWWQPAVLGQAAIVLSVTARGPIAGGHFATAPGLGLAGMVKSISRELPDRSIRIVDLDPDADADTLCGRVVDELSDVDGPVDIRYEAAARYTPVVEPRPLATSITTDDDHGRPSPRTSLHPDSVVLLTGEARGITARAAVGLARATGCRIELVGRTAEPNEPEDPDLASAPDRPALRQALLAKDGFDAPAAIEAECSRLLADREIRATLAAITALGSEVHYHQVDVRDREALGALVHDLHSRCGRVDLIVHGAGVLDDRLLRDKRPEGFDRVFATKVDAARALLEVAGPSTPIVFFASVSGVFGTRGQVDYSAANDAVDELAETAGRAGSGQILSIDWGPWAGTGMVSAELEREYARRGVGLVDPDEGVRALLDELQGPASGPARVVVMRAHPDAFVPEPSRARPIIAVRA